MTRSQLLASVLLLPVAVFGCDRPTGSSAQVSSAGTPTAPMAPSAKNQEDEPPADIVTGVPDQSEPVVAGAALRPAKVRPGESLTLFVQARVAPTWHIYGAQGSTGEAIPTTLNLNLPAGVELDGTWIYPPAKPAAGGPGLVYEGTVTFRQKLRVASGAAPGPLEVTCEFGYQVCTPFSCRPPAKLVLKASAEVVAKD